MSDDSRKTFATSLQVLGASAGIAAFFTFLGGALMWIRFDELRLPADRSVALLPKELLLTVGAHALVGPVLVSLLVLVALVAFEPTEEETNDEGQATGRWVLKKRFWAFLGVVLVLGGAFCVLEVIDYDLVPEELIMYGALGLGLVAIVLTARKETRRKLLLGVTCVTVLLVGGVLAVVKTLGAPKMEPVAVVLKKEAGFGGFLVGETADRLFVVPLPGSGDPGDPFADAEVDRLVVLSRDDVDRLAVRAPSGVRSNEGGREEAQTLLADLRTASGEPPPNETVTTANPVTAFAPLVHIHSEEDLLPMEVEAFLRNSWLMWSHDRCPDYSITLAAHLKRADAQRGQIMGQFARRRLGSADPHRHVPATKGCSDARRPVVSANQHTRPFDADKARDARDATSRVDGLSEKEGFYLDLWDEKRKGADRNAHVVKEGAQQVLRGVPMFYEQDDERIEGKPGTRITYWFFYGQSQPPGGRPTRFVTHEGDWERISVLLLKLPRRDQYRPVSARYHFHDENRVVPWRSVRLVGSGGPEPATHPVVYSAKRSHASFPRAGSYESVFRVRGRRQFAVRDEAIACPECPIWRTWEDFADARIQAWYGFGGAWGQVGTMMGTTGPLGPSPFKIGPRSPSPENVASAQPPAATGGSSGPPLPKDSALRPKPDEPAPDEPAPAD